MTNSSQKKKQKGKAVSFIFLKVLPAALIVWLLIYTLFFSFSVRKQIKTWQSEPEKEADTIKQTHEEWKLMKEKSFLTARINLAGNDSIGMTINLEDSLVQLETRGVVLRQIRIDKSEISRFFRSFNPEAYVRVFSKPFTITEIEGSIVKEPIVVKKAPRDTTEAASNATPLDTGKVEFVEWHLQLDSTFVVSFVQSDQGTGSFDWPTVKYRLRRYSKTLIESNKRLFQLKTPDYSPEITIFLPGKDAKSFFRALPRNGEVALKL